MKWEVISDPFLGNGSANAFPRQRLSMQRGKRNIVYGVRAEKLQKEENWGNQSVEFCMRG
jgi:hypothetical protein